MKLGTFIKQKRIELNLSLSDIEKSGFHKGSWSRIENNGTLPKPDVLRKVAKILEINVTELYIVIGYLIDEDIEYIKNNK